METKKGSILIALAMTFLTLFGTVQNTVKASMLDQGYTATCVSDNSSTNSVQSGANPTTSGASGSWTQQGSKAYNNAKQVFTFWTGKGFSGASAAGVVGNVGTESMHEFDPTIVQGGGHSNDPSSAGNGGYGLYQFTPGAKLKQIQGYTGPTVDNEDDCMWNGYQGAAIANGVKNYSGLKQLGGGDDVNQATELWEQKVEAAGQPNMSDRISGAQKAYQMFGGSNIKANSALLAGASTAGGTGNNGGVSQSNSGNSSNPDCSNGNNGNSAPGDNGSIVSIARSLMGWFHYPNPDRHNVQLCTKDGKLNSKDDLKKDGITDCSGFVWIVLKLAGYNVPANMGWFTGTMAQDAKGPHKWFKQIDPKDAKPGDVIIVNEGSGEGENGHTAIITENWHGYDTKCINEGGDDQTVFHNDGVCEDTIQRNFGTMVQQGDVTIAEPVKGNSK